MPSVLIKNLPDPLHRELKLRAERHHRSLNKELIALIEAALTDGPPPGRFESARSPDPMVRDLLADLDRRRAIGILALQGRYRNALSSSDAFAARKAEEIALER